MFLKSYFARILLGTLVSVSLSVAAPSKKKIPPSSKTEIKKTIEKTDDVKESESTTKASTPFIGLPLDIDVLAREAYMIDYDTGAVLLEKDATKPMHPSSMTKIMTAYLVIDKIKTGVIKKDSIFTVSKNGWRVEGSTSYLNINDQVKVEDLLKGLIIQSGNDASVILAENISGSESAFASEMTRRAHDMGAKQTNFLNASGLPLPEHQTTAKDLAIISEHAIKDQAEFYPIYSEKEYTYGKTTQGNRNPLLYNNTIGCDGIKTGHTEIAGYGMVASCMQDGRRIILVINGLKSKQARADEARKLSIWGLHTFTNKTIAIAQQVLGEIPVVYGTLEHVNAVVRNSCIVTVPKSFENELKTTIELTESIEAPIASGMTLGKVIVTCPAFKESIIFDLIAEKDVEKAGFIKRIGQKIAAVFKRK
ncbi:MAG: D-alanyl-D-alanine carboxypeptidase family protein [Pseudomonadota bacterium]